MVCDGRMSLDYFPETQADLLRHLESWTGEAATGGELTSAVEVLCERYRDSIRLWMLRRGLSAPDAEDVTHDFLQRWLNLRLFGGFESRGRRFREYLSVCLGHFLTERARAGVRLKRGGGQVHLPLEEMTSEPWEQPADLSLDAEVAWEVFERVRSGMLADGLVGTIGSAEMLRRVALSGTAVPYQELARELGISLSVVKVRVMRIRSEFRERFRKEVLLMCSDPEAADLEEVTLREILLESDPSVRMDLGPVRGTNPDVS